ncbi:MAG: hypothetical protein M3P82_05330 [Bacteroidota bacterium]|nr:hypothetical protein [Bacteroidota bacterium]
MIEQFKQLTADELYQFQKFVYSSYFTSQKNLVKLFNYLDSLYPNIPEEALTKEKISIVIYGENKVNDLKIRKLISDFSILMEKFYTHLEIESNKTGNEILLLGSLRRRGITKRFEMNCNLLYKQMEKSFSKDDVYYLNRINLDNEKIYFNFSKSKREYNKYLQDKSDNLDYYYMFSKLHTFNEMLHSEGRRNKLNFYNRTLLSEILTLVKLNKDKIASYHPNLYIIYIVFLMFDTLEDKYLKELQSYLEKYEKKFKKEKLSYYYHYVTQYYIQKISMGEREYNAKVFEIYKTLKDKNLFLIDKIITDEEFNSVVNISLSVREFSWADTFIEEYKRYLHPAFANAAYNLAKAKLIFFRKEYQNIFPYLNEVEFKEPVYYINSKFLLGRVYFEIKNTEGLRYIIANLKQYLRTKRNLMTEQIDSIKVFNNYMTDLISLYESRSPEQKTLRVVLKKELDNEKKFVPSKNWFYEKLIEI